VKELRGQATGTVSVNAERCFAVLLAVDRYPTAYPEVIRRVEVMERHVDGSPVLALATVSLGVGPVQRDFELQIRVSWQKHRLVRLTRVPEDHSDDERVTVTWHITAGPPTRLMVKLRARLEVPRVIPVRGAGGVVARGLLDAAARTLENRA
jgi:polyketide cyclase/dehydrase/lipid transport protein